MDKKAIYWSLLWPSKVVSEHALSRYPDLELINNQINLVANSIVIDGSKGMIQGIDFDIRDFPTNDRISQREFAWVTGISFDGIEDVKFGKKSWEVLDKFEILVIGMHKRLRDVLGDDHNSYRDTGYRELDEGDIALYKGREVTVARRSGANLMKYYLEHDKYHPILPSNFERKVRGRTKYVEEVAGFIFNGNQLEMVF